MILGLTGCPGSGKSLVAAVITGRGWVLVDADRIGRDVVTDDPSVMTELLEAFGKDIIGPDGMLDRRLVARRAFATGEGTDRLNRAVQPALINRLAETVWTLRSQGMNGVVDCALVFEWGIEALFDMVVCVTADAGIRTRRLRERDGRTDEDIRRLFSAQLPEYEKARRADLVFVNDGPMERLAAFGCMIAGFPSCMEEGRIWLKQPR